MFTKALILMFAAELLSFVAFNFPVLSLPLIILASLAAVILSWRRPEWGIYLLFGELFFGSRGHLLEYDLGFVTVSLRLVIFAAVFIVWMLRFPVWKLEIGNWKFRILYLLLLLVICLGIANGYLHGNLLANIFNDANGFLYLLILPAVVSIIKSREQVENILQILAAAIIVVAAKTLLLFLWFAFGFPGVASAYHWIITQDFGEITGDVGSASRIFMQSQFWALMGLFIFSFFTLPQPPPERPSGRAGLPSPPAERAGREGNSSPLRGEDKGGGVLNWIIVSAALLSVVMSLSRSFWLGAVAGGLFAIFIVLLRFRSNFKAFLAIGLKLALIVILEIAILYGIVAIGGGGLAESVSSRGMNPSQEAAGGARLLLLPPLIDAIKQAPIFGAGFGTLVTYKSYLPDRVTDENPDGEITSFAFEWGYLDILLKIGAVGLIVYLFFIANIFKLAWENLQFTTYPDQSRGSRIANRDNFATLGLLSALVALLALNFTTPYLNHPLGIGYIIFVYSYLFVIRKAHDPAS